MYCQLVASRGRERRAVVELKPWDLEGVGLAVVGRLGISVQRSRRHRRRRWICGI